MEIPTNMQPVLIDVSSNQVSGAPLILPVELIFDNVPLLPQNVSAPQFSIDGPLLLRYGRRVFDALQ